MFEEEASQQEQRRQVGAGGWQHKGGARALQHGWAQIESEVSETKVMQQDQCMQVGGSEGWERQGKLQGEGDGGAGWGRMYCSLEQRSSVCR